MAFSEYVPTVFPKIMSGDINTTNNLKSDKI